MNNPHKYKPQMESLAYALTLRPGDRVNVDTSSGGGIPQYHGPGVISRHTTYDSHVVWLDHAGICVAVKLPNGNVWLYPALEVARAAEER